MLRRILITLGFVVATAFLVSVAVAAPSLNGSKGLLRVLSADNDTKGALSVGVHGSYWSLDSTATNPKTSDIYFFPSLGYAIIDQVEVSTALGYRMLKYTYGGTDYYYNGLTDTEAGLKLSYSPIPLFTGGLYAFGLIPTQDDTFATRDENAVDFGGKALFTFDFGKLEESVVPLRLHLNAGYLMVTDKDSVGTKLETTNQDEQILYGFGLEYKTPYVTPFVELSGRYFLNASDSTLAGWDASGKVSRSILQKPLIVTPGLRATFPFGLNLDLALDWNLTGEDSAKHIEKEQVGMPWDWQIVAGLSYSYDFFPAVPPAPPTGTIAGKISDAATGEPLEAEISFPGTEVPTVYSDATGAYTASGLPVGEVTVSVSKEGYISQDAPVTVAKKKITTQDFSLEKKPIPKGTISGKITDKITGNPLGATISYSGPESGTITADPTTGIYTVTVQTGNYTVTSSYTDYVSKTVPVTVNENRTTMQHFQLLAKAAKITLKGVTFASGKSTILPESYSALDEAATILTENPEIRVEIAGYTDSRGSKAKNIKLSQARANAVREYLIGKGISGDRLVANGYGPKDPVADNRTKEGRALNRRIEFHVLP